MSENERKAIDSLSPSQLWDQDASKRALDELFTEAASYRSTKSYQELLQFISRFRRYSPFNAMLVYVQKPGARYVLPAHKWKRLYQREVEPGAQPIVILQPMGPVMFVFDVSETVGAPLPPEVAEPFALRSGSIQASRLERTINNALRDGIQVKRVAHGSQLAGSIEASPLAGQSLRFGENAIVPLRYVMLLNSNHDLSVQYATLVHELAHLYCGHLGTPNHKWWPDRQGLGRNEEEFEAESICFLVCQRL